MDMISEMYVGAPWGGNLTGGSMGAEVPEGLSEFMGSAWAMSEDIWSRAKRDAELRDREKQERLKAAEVLHHVWLYDEEADSRAAVDASDKYSFYGSGRTRCTDELLPVYGRDYAEAVMPNVADDPWACIEAQLEAEEDEGRKAKYRAEFEALKLKGGDTANDYYGLYGRMVRDGVRGRYAAFKAKEAAVQVSLGKMNRYVAGEDVLEVGAEGAEDGFTDEDLANARSIADPKMLEDAEAVRAFMRTYVKPLGQKDDAEEILHSLSQLEDELFECIGEDVQRAELVREALMDFAEGVKKSNKVGPWDEFVVAVGKKLQDWGDVRTRSLFSTQGAVGAAGAMNMGALHSAAGQIQSAAVESKERHAARSALRAAINKSLEVDESESMWKGSLRAMFAMAGDTLPYLVPGVGMGLGTADVAVRGITETADMYKLNGLTGEQAGGQAFIDTAVQAGVELLPFSRVGGKGLSAFVKSRFGKGVAKGKVGALSRWAVRQTQKSVGRALAAEWGAAMVDEAVLEPVAGGLLQYGAEHIFDAMGLEHGQTKELAACFEELKQVWEPRQLAGLALFTAGLTGVTTPAVVKNVRYFAAKRVMWEAEGLKPGQVDELMAIKDMDERVEKGRKMVDDGWENDAAGMAARKAKQNAAIKERGEVLVMTGEGAVDPAVENSELAPAYRAVWNEYVEKGLLPKVEAQKDGQFKLTHNGKEYVMSAAHADAYLEHAIAEAEKVMLAEARTAAERKGVNLRAEIGQAVSYIAGNAALRAVAKSEQSGIEVQDLVAGLPESLAAPILAKGYATLEDAKAISEWALGQIRALVEGGASDFDARMTRPEADGMARSLGEWSTFATDFATRERVEGLKPGEGAISVGRYSGQKTVRFNGREVLGQVIMGIQGRVSHYGAVEDITESVMEMMLQQRAAVLVEQGVAGSLAEGDAMALEELAAVVRRAREVVLKADPKAAISEVKEGKDFRMSVMEALSKMARAKFLSSGVVPKWMEALTSGLKGILGVGAAVESVRAAYAEVLRKEPNALAELEGMLSEMGVHVQDAMREARIEAVDIQAWKAASAIVGARAAGPMGAGGAAVSDAVQEAEATEQEIVEAEGKQEVLPVRSAAEVAAEAKARIDEMVPESNMPEEMRGVFVDDKGYYYEAGGIWCGMIAKEKLSDGTEQVKVGVKGKHGVIQGKELTGNFRHDTAAIHVWMRKDGRLQVISGRHRYAKLLEDDSAASCNCYVYVETDERDEKWARMLDYELNMCDDQADEVTAATYVRETGLSDEELFRRGLTRGKSRSKRGVFIGRHARQELWTRFVNGAVKPKDAEIICELTRSVKAEDRIDEIQGKCCMLLDTGKSWEYIGGMVQLMASKEAQMKQGLLDFGADFMEDLARAAEWIEKCVHKVDAAIKMLRNGRKMSGEMREEALRLGVQTETDADSEEVLRDLQLLRKKFELIGSYPDLVAQAQMWDGKSEVDPVGYYLENARKERIEAQLEGEMTAEEYLAEQARKAAAEAVPNLFTMEMVKREVTPEMEMFANGFHEVARSSAVVASLSGVYVADIKAAKGEMKLLYDELKKEPIVMPDGRLISFTGRGYKEVTSHAADRRVLASFAKLRELCSKAVYLCAAPNTQREIPSKRWINQFHYYLSKGNYPEFKGWREQQGETEDVSGDAYVLIVVAEGESGGVFYDLDVTSVEEVENNKGVSENLEATRIPNPGRQDSNTPKGRIHRFKEHVNHIDAVNEKSSFSLDKAQAAGMFRDGHLVASNAVVTEPGVSFSIEALHASPYRFRKFSTDKMGTGEGAQAYGWGLYFAESEEVNEFYFNKFYNLKTVTCYIDDEVVTKQEMIDCITRFSFMALGDTKECKKLANSIISRAMYLGSFADALRFIRNNIDDYSDDSSEAREILEALDMLEDGGFEIKAEASVSNYRVELNVDDSNLLMWDGTLLVSSLPVELQKYINSKMEMYAYASGEEFYRDISRWEKGAKQASELLLAHGIKGIKYLDGASRGKGKGSFNYVIFSGDDVKITGVNETGDFNAPWEGYTDTTATFSMERNLAAVHSIPLDTMLDVEKKLGGLPKPSIAITRLDKPYSWGYSERVYLIGKPELADPQKGNLVYDRDAWTGKGPFLLEGGSAYDYRKGEYFEPTLEAFVERTIKKKGMEDGSSFRGQAAVSIGTMDAVKAHREKLSDTDTSNAQKAETDAALEKLIENVVKLSKKGLNEDEVAMVLARVCWRSSPMNHGAPSEMKTSRDTAKRILNELGVRVKDIKKPLVDSFLKAVEGLKDEMEDYLESVPQRAVMFNEWEYAVMPESMKDTPGLDEMLERNSIKPVFHDGTEEGRRAAFAGLVNDSRVSFSVIGPKAETWDKHADRAFKGRDDGKLRAEIDASGAKVKAGMFGMDRVKVYRDLIAGWDNLPEDGRKAVLAWYELQKQYKETRTAWRIAEKATYREVQEKEAAADAAKGAAFTAIEGWFNERGVSGLRQLLGGSVMEQLAVSLCERTEDSLIVREMMSNHSRLGKVLDFPELYEAYPVLKGIPVELQALEGYNGVVTNYAYGAEYSIIKINKQLMEDTDAFRSTLLHEVQHVIQRIEGYAKGGNVEGVYKRMKDELEYNEAEMNRLAKELRWFSALDYAKDYLKSARRLLRFPNAWKYNGLRYRHWKAALGNEDMTRLMVNDIAEQYEEMRKADEFETKRRGNWIKPVEYALPMVDFSDLSGVERGLAALEGLKSRRSAFRGVAPKKDKEYIKLMKYTNAAKRMLDKYEMEPYELYRRLAGEIEARNVQTRRDWTMDERLARPFNETLEYPGEALVTFSMEPNLMQNIRRAAYNKLDKKQRILLCSMPTVLRMLGEPEGDVYTLPSTISKLVYTHNLAHVEVYRAIQELDDPMFVYRETSKTFVFVLEMEATNNKGVKSNVMVAIEMERSSSGHYLMSAYPLDALKKVKDLQRQGLMVYSKYTPEELEYRINNEATPPTDNAPSPFKLELMRSAVKGGLDDMVMTRHDIVKFNQANFSASMEKASLQALEVLRTRSDEREGERLMNDWQKACEGWAQLHVGGDDSRLGNGAKMLGEIYALIGATKGVLPEKYARMGHLNGLLRWAAVYANMQQTGDVPAEGVIAGPIYEKFVERMRYIDKKNEAYGLNDAEVKEAMALLAGERLDVAMLKVARECKRRLEMFLKDRERERIDWVVERAYPKREKGKRSPRGKMDAETYRRMERAYRLMEMEANDVAGLMNRIKAALENMETAPADAVEVLRSLRGGDVPGVDEVDALEAELEDELFLAQTFGCWENMAFEQARRASGAMAELVLLGRSAWQSKLRAERRRAAFDRDEVSRHFGTKLEEVQAVRGDKTAKEKGRKRTSAKNLVMGSMSYSQLLVALEEKLGKRFTGRHMRMIAEAHESIMVENQRRHRWMYNTLRDITGLETEGEIEEWMQKNNEVFDTGIDLELPMKSTCRLTPEEAKMWLSLTAAERQKKREELVAEAAKKGEKPDNIPGEDVMAELEEKLVNAELNAAMPKEFVLTSEWSYKSRLRCTREALLYAILTFEQEDYEHLLEANGLTQAKLQQMRKLVGKELLRWGYAMRKELSEHGKLVAELYEAYTGVPFGQRQNYFRGVFDVARAKDAGEAVDQVSGVTGGKYGILIARQYHNQQLNWSTSASLVFVSTMKEQQNYIATAHITREWRTLLSDRLFERRVRAEIGDAALDMLTGWMKMIEGAALADVKVNAMMNNMLSKLAKAYAVSRLAGNAYTIMKQASALLNGFVGGYVPERVLAGNELVQELTYRHVGFGEYMAALGKAMAGKTEITMKELESAGFIEGRKNVQGSHIEEAALLSPWQTVPGKVGRKGRALYEANMDAIGYVDRKANAKAALAIAEVVYQQAKKENADGLVPDAELRRVAIETARMMVDRAAQPQLRTQKGFLAAGGGMFGALGNFFYMFKSETLNKLGLYVAQMMAGQHRAWLVGALSFGVMNSVVLALIDWICGRWYDDDDEKWEKRAKSFAGNVLFNDIATVPFAGDIVDWVRGQWLGERYWASNSLVSWGTDTWKYGAREWKNIEKGASWDKHVTALCSLARSVGALGGVGLNGHSAAIGSCCELTLAAASLSNTVRFVKDVVKKVVGE